MGLDILRYTVFGVFVLATAAAVGSWAVRTRRISPFSKWANLIRRATDPMLRPLEDSIQRRGGNPQTAEWWLLGGTIVGGILLISAAGWLVNQVRLISSAGRLGPGALLRVGIYYAGQIVSLALVVRVIGSWFGAGRHHRFMRPMYFLTDWIVEPLRRVIPPIGMIDISPLVAWFLIQILMGMFL
jgi:YggT family protein